MHGFLLIFSPFFCFLKDAKSRFTKSLEDKEKVRREKIELAEKRQREIYLNGGFVDCVNSGCGGQGTSETSYLCRPCFSEQQSYRSSSSKAESVADRAASPKSTFYVSQPTVLHV